MRRYFEVLGVILVMIMLSGCAERVVYKVPEPPPPRAEVITVAPFPSAVWIPGHWVWKGRHQGYYWITGHWRRS